MNRSQMQLTKSGISIPLEQYVVFCVCLKIKLNREQEMEIGIGMEKGCRLPTELGSPCVRSPRDYGVNGEKGTNHQASK